MPSRIGLALLLCILLPAAACRQQGPLQDSYHGNKTLPEAQHSDGAANFSGLPGIDSLPAPARHASSTARFALLEADVLAEHNSFFHEFGFELSAEFDEVELSYIVFGVSVEAGSYPQRLDLSAGSMNDAYLFAADFSIMRWHFIGGGYNQPRCLVDLPAAGAGAPALVSEAGEFMVAVVAAPRYYGISEGYLSLRVVSEEGDNTHPSWPGAEGIAGVEGSFPTVVSYNEGSDDNGPLVALVFNVPADFGIDWRFPLDMFYAEDFAAEGYGIFGDAGYPQHYAVRMMDAAGNISENVNFIEYTPEDEFSEHVPLRGLLATGDELRLTWTDPEIDLDLYLSAPNFDEASQVYPEFAGRSFRLGESSVESGLAEERVWIRPSAARGTYSLILQNFGEESASGSIKIFDAEGNLKQDLGSHDVGPGERDIAILNLPWPQPAG